MVVLGVVGGAFGSAAKITGELGPPQTPAPFLSGLVGEIVFALFGVWPGTLAGLVEGVAGLNEEEPLRDRGARERPQHLGDGLVQGGQVLFRSIKTGVTGLVEHPREGASREGIAGFLKGVGKGALGLMAAPVVGTLGAFSRVTEGVDATVSESVLCLWRGLAFLTWVVALLFNTHTPDVLLRCAEARHSEEERSGGSPRTVTAAARAGGSGPR
jgi:hypothetical protein